MKNPYTIYMSVICLCFSLSSKSLVPENPDIGGGGNKGRGLRKPKTGFNPPFGWPLFQNRFLLEGGGAQGWGGPCPPIGGPRGGVFLGPPFSPGGGSNPGGDTTEGAPLWVVCGGGTPQVFFFCAGVKKPPWGRGGEKKFSHRAGESKIISTGERVLPPQGNAGATSRRRGGAHKKEHHKGGTDCG